MTIDYKEFVNRKVTANFRLGEFFVSESYTQEKLLRDFFKLPLAEQTKILRNIQALAYAMERIRHIFGDKAIMIASGWRSFACNKIVGGAPHSCHLDGRAADFHVEGISPHDVQQRLDKLWGGGLEFAPTWTHADIGPRRRFTP